jgi:MFS family permease
MKYTYKHTLHACYLGLFTQAVVNNLAPLLFIVFQDKFKLSFEMIGRLILINFVTQIIADILAVKYADRIGIRNAAVLAHIFCALGLIGLGVLPVLLPSPYLGLVIAVVIYALGGGLIEVLISPIVNSLPSDAKASAMSLLHSFYCWGQMAVVLITTFIIKAVSTDIWYVLPVLWSVIPLYNLYKFIKVPLVPAIPEHEKIPVKQLWRSKIFIIALMLMMCAGASELTMSQWSSLFAEKGLQMPKLMGDILGPCLFAFLMGIGRSIYGFWGHKIDLKKALIASGILCIACYAVTVFIHIPLISLLGCAVCGLSISLMWPGTLSLTAERYPTGGTTLFGIMAVFGDVGCSIGPWLAGLVSDLAQKSPKLVAIGAANNLNSDQLGLKCGLLIALIFPLILTISILMLKSPKAITQPPPAGAGGSLAD